MCEVLPTIDEASPSPEEESARLEQLMISMLEVSLSLSFIPLLIISTLLLSLSRLITRPSNVIPLPPSLPPLPPSLLGEREVDGQVKRNTGSLPDHVTPSLSNRDRQFNTFKAVTSFTSKRRGNCSFFKTVTWIG